MFSAQGPDFYFYASELNHKLNKILCLDEADSSLLSISVGMESHVLCSVKGNYHILETADW